ncbi:hypothetical protein HQ38_08790 [Porphyromonas crevioricanis]|uniref:Por secretion system C-terminal sorting domain n=1 Tax=Porphyromonas crevioricanis TaxID=393921 RepID=A0AB34PE69_9PORP|nr:hypothetical protein HQ38_08790 [Porphyromonas crevioricanis]
MFAFGFGLRLQAQTEEATQDLLPVGGKWYYNQESAGWMIGPPDNDMNKAERCIGVIVNEVTAEETLDTEIKKTVVRTRYNYLKQVVSVFTSYLYVQPNGDIWGQDEGEKAVRNLFHSPNKKVGERWSVTIDDNGTPREAELELTFVAKQRDGSIVHCYCLFLSGKSRPLLAYCYADHPFRLEDELYPIGGTFTGIGWCDVPLKDANIDGYRGYVAPDGTVYETDWWKRNPFHDIGIDGVYHRPLALPVVQNPEGWYRYDRLSGVAVSEVSGQLYLYGMDGRLVRMGYGQVSTLGLPTGIYVLKSMDTPRCYAKILVE